MYVEVEGWLLEQLVQVRESCEGLLEGGDGAERQGSGGWCTVAAVPRKSVSHNAP